MPSNRKIALVIVAIVAIATSIHAIVDYRILGIGYVDELGGLCYISDIQDTNDNESYTVLFNEVSFTFLYYTLPIYYDENGTGYVLPDAPDTAHFRLTYPDETVDYLNLSIGGYAPIRFGSPLRPVLGFHDYITAGVATAFTPQMHYRWVLFVLI